MRKLDSYFKNNKWNLRGSGGGTGEGSEMIVGPIINIINIMNNKYDR